MPNACMIDMETFGQEADALVLSFAATIFDTENQVFHSFGQYSATVQMRGQLKGPLARAITPDTVSYWMLQSQEAREAIFKTKDKDKTPILDVLGIFATIYKDHHCTELWSLGVDFDVAILSHLYEQYGMEKPWGYRDGNCFRALRKRADVEQVKHPYTNLDKHNASADAEFQAMCLWYFGKRMTIR